MKSMVVGPMEQTVMETVEHIRSVGMVGLEVKLSPDAAVATANTIEKLAQFYDNLSASTHQDAQIIRGLVYLCGALLVTIAYLIT